MATDVSPNSSSGGPEAVRGPDYFYEEMATMHKIAYVILALGVVALGAAIACGFNVLPLGNRITNLSLVGVFSFVSLVSLVFGLYLLKKPYWKDDKFTETLVSSYCASIDRRGYAATERISVFIEARKQGYITNNIANRYILVESQDKVLQLVDDEFLKIAESEFGLKGEDCVAACLKERLKAMCFEKKGKLSFRNVFEKFGDRVWTYLPKIFESEIDVIRLGLKAGLAEEFPLGVFSADLFLASYSSNDLENMCRHGLIKKLGHESYRVAD